MGIFSQECVSDVVSCLDHLFAIIQGNMCSTDPFRFRWLRGCVCTSFYHHQIRSCRGWELGFCFLGGGHLQPCGWAFSSFFNSLWPSDTVWHRSRSTSAQVMACCLMTPSHYLNQCWPGAQWVKCHHLGCWNNPILLNFWLCMLNTLHESSYIVASFSSLFSIVLWETLPGNILLLSVEFSSQ